MSTTSSHPRGSAPSVEIVIPVLNEERLLRHSVLRLARFVSEQLPRIDVRITIADSDSQDATAQIGEALARELRGVGYLRLPARGRGRALRAAWTASEAEVLAYMDVDLSTDLAALPPLLAPLLDGRADVAIGSRLSPGAQVTRSRRRELISRTYNALLGALLHAGFSDAQCGFKAVRRDALTELLALIEDDCWFFDTELLYLAQRNRMVIHEVPVRWVEDPDSRVKLVSTALADLRGIARLRRATRLGTDRTVVARPAAGARVSAA